MDTSSGVGTNEERTGKKTCVGRVRARSRSQSRSVARVSPQVNDVDPFLGDSDEDL